jgi:hypothetical protein
MPIMARSVAVTAGLALVLSSALAFAFRPAVYPPYDEGRIYVATECSIPSQADFGSSCS